MSRQQLLRQEAIMREYERWLELLGRLRGELTSGPIDTPLLHGDEEVK
jgi:malate synthase